MDVGTFIKQKRGARTLTSLATAIGVSVGYLSDVEKGRRSLTVERARQIAKELHMPIDEEERLLGMAALSQHRISFVVDELSDAGRQALLALSGSAPRLEAKEWAAIEKIARGS